MNLRNNNGFTLVELLAVLVILSIIALVAYPIVIDVIGGAKKDLGVEQKIRVIEVAKEWAVKYAVEDEYCLTIGKMKSDGYLENVNIKDPETGSNMNGGVGIVWSGSQYEYSYYSSVSGCDSDDNPSVCKCTGTATSYNDLLEASN